jgi:hypothetical protein
VKIVMQLSLGNRPSVFGQSDTFAFWDIDSPWDEWRKGFDQPRGALTSVVRLVDHSYPVLIIETDVERSTRGNHKA